MLNSYDGNEKILYILLNNFFSEETLFQPLISVFCNELNKIDPPSQGTPLDEKDFVGV